MASPAPKEREHHQAEPRERSARSHRERDRDGDRLHFLKDEQYPTPPPRERPAPRERAGRHPRPQQKTEPRSSQPAGQDSVLKKYWWVGAAGVGVLLLVAVSRS